MRKGGKKNEGRNYLSVYFPVIDGAGKRRAKNVCIAFNDGEKALFEKLRKLESKEIKKNISIFTYRKLAECAEKENRKPTELIKLRLAEKLINKGGSIRRTVEFNPAKVKKWIGILTEKKIGGEITGFLEAMISDTGGASEQGEKK